MNPNHRLFLTIGMFSLSLVAGLVAQETPGSQVGKADASAFTPIATVPAPADGTTKAPESPVRKASGELWDDLRISVPKAPVPGSSTNKTGTFFAPSMSIKPKPVLQTPFQETESKRFREEMTRGNLNLSSNLYYKASRHFWEASRIDPENEDSLSSLAVCFLMSGDSERAIPFYRALIDRNPAVEDYRFNLASALYKQESYSQAIDELEKLMEDYPKQPKLLYNLGINHLALGNMKAASIYLRKSYENLPENPFPLLALARLHSKQEDKLKMLSELEKAALLMNGEELRLYLNHPAFKRWKEPGLYDRIISKSL